MDLLRSGLKSVLGQTEPAAELSGADTVERLLDRLRSSSLLEDRRDACRALRSMSKKYRVEVGAQGMPDLLAVTTDEGGGGGDPECIGLALDTLCNITAQGTLATDDDDDLDGAEVGDQFTEMLIKSPSSVHHVLALLAEFEFRVRFSAVRLLTNLLQNRTRHVQDIVMVAPQGVSRIMDLLNDPREVVRNDALVMLTLLVKGNANLQKIVAFENAFDRLCEVMVEEGGVDGGIVVEDCLSLVLALLGNNSSNQSFFREGSYIQRLTTLFEALASDEDAAARDHTDAGWSAQKVSNAHHMLKVVRALVSPANASQETAAAQRQMSSCGLLSLLCGLLMSAAVPADILTETIACVAELCRGCAESQRYLCGVCAPSSPPRPALVVLLMSMVNERQPLSLRCAVLYCFQCQLYHNADGQRRLIETLLPTEPVDAAETDVTAGHLLCSGLFSSHPLSIWFSAVALSQALVNSHQQRVQLLRVQLATATDQPAVTLLHQLLEILQQPASVAVARLGLLQLLATWMAGCAAAISQLLKQAAAVPYLMSQLSSNECDDLEQLCHGVCAFIVGVCVMTGDDDVTATGRQQLVQLVERRVGVETFLNKLAHLAKHEMYSRSLKHPQLSARDKQQVALDHEFCLLFKALEPAVIAAVSRGTGSVGTAVSGVTDNGSGYQTSLAGSTTTTGTSVPVSAGDEHPVQHYQQLIREQDVQLAELKLSENSLRDNLTARSEQVEQLSATVQQLRDQITLLRAQMARECNVTSPSVSSVQDHGDSSHYQHAPTETSAGNVHVTADSLKVQYEQQIHTVRTQHEHQLAALRTSCEQQLAVLTDDNVRLNQTLNELQARQHVTDEQEVLVLRQRVAQLEAYCATHVSDNTDAHHITDMPDQLATINEQNRQLAAQLAEVREEKQQLATQLAEVRGEQDDLLVLLTDQEARLEHCTRQLRQLGVHVPVEDDAT